MKEQYKKKKLEEFGEKYADFCDDITLLMDMTDFISQLIDESFMVGRDSTIKHVADNIGFLRQWLNEDRITDPNKIVDNEQIAVWILSNVPTGEQMNYPRKEKR